MVAVHSQDTIMHFGEHITMTQIFYILKNYP